MRSSDLTTEIRFARPLAPASLRERVAAIAAEPPRERRSHLPTRPLRRVSLVAVPTAAVLAVASAAVIGLARSGEHAQPGGETLSAVGASTTPTRELQPQSTPQRGALGQDDSQAGAGATEAQKAAPSTVPAPTPGRLQRYEASLRLRVDGVDDLSRATQRALRVTRELGGYVVSAQTSVPERGRGGAELVVRVPRAQVQKAIVSFSQLGTILAQNVRIDDLQAQVDDLTDRIATLVGEIARIRRQLENPNLPDETRARLSARLADDRRQLADLRTAKRETTREGELATVSLSLTTEKEAAAPPASGGRIDRALDRAGDVLAWEAAVLLVAFVTVGPLGLLALLIWFALRLTRRRAEERLLEQS